MVAPNDQGEWVEIYDKEPMKKAMLLTYGFKLKRAHITPFIQSPLSNGWTDMKKIQVIR